MEVALGVIVALLLFILGWAFAHSTQCSAFHERVAALEERMKAVEKK